MTAFKVTVAYMALVFNGGIIVFLLWRGDGASPLHASAMTWAFKTGICVIAALLGFDALIPMFAKALAP